MGFFDIVTKRGERRRRMETAAGVSSVTLRCHPETWRQISDLCWSSKPELEGGERGLVDVTLCGPDLMVLLHKCGRSWNFLEPDRSLAARVYRQCAAVLDEVDPAASPGTPIPPIVLDDKLGEKVD